MSLGLPSRNHDDETASEGAVEQMGHKLAGLFASVAGVDGESASAQEKELTTASAGSWKAMNFDQPIVDTMPSRTRKEVCVNMHRKLCRFCGIQIIQVFSA